MAELMAACKAGGVWPFAHFNRLQVTPPCTTTPDEAREGLAAIDKALEVADRYCRADSPGRIPLRIDWLNAGPATEPGPTDLQPGGSALAGPECRVRPTSRNPPVEACVSIAYIRVKLGDSRVRFRTALRLPPDGRRLDRESLSGRLPPGCGRGGPRDRRSSDQATAAPHHDLVRGWRGHCRRCDREPAGRAQRGRQRQRQEEERQAPPPAPVELTAVLAAPSRPSSRPPPRSRRATPRPWSRRAAGEVVEVLVDEGASGSRRAGAGPARRHRGPARGRSAPRSRSRTGQARGRARPAAQGPGLT